MPIDGVDVGTQTAYVPLGAGTVDSTTTSEATFAFPMSMKHTMMETKQDEAPKKVMVKTLFSLLYSRLQSNNGHKDLPILYQSN